MATKKNIANYLGEHTNKTFVVPAYQRGFKWGVTYENNKSAATVLFNNINQAIQANKQEYFIQGVTVYEEGTNVVLIDGQQRTTVLFLLLSLLLNKLEKEKYLFYQNSFKIHYTIREQSHTVLEQICKGNSIHNTEENTPQDIFFFQQVIEQFNELLISFTNEEKNKLKDYILNKVKLFYIKVAKEQAIKLFTMMNGAKAFMKTDELVKADILSKASIIDYNRQESPKNIQESLEILKDQIGEDWKSSALRSEFARQWDKWMYWWNQEEVSLFFNSGEHPMGLLLKYFYERNYKNEENNSQKKIRATYTNTSSEVAQMFGDFQNLLLQDKNNAQHNFEALRKLQKRFEDIFTIIPIYNYFGLAFETLKSKEDRNKIINFFLENYKEIAVIKEYVLLKILNLNIDKTETIKYELSAVFESLNNAKVYEEDDKEFAFRLLLKINVEAAIERNVKFDFYIKNDDKLESLYTKRSLEHIWPKSKIAKKDVVNTYLDTNNNIIESSDLENYLKIEELDKVSLSQHHIGNLVLLHRNDNSTFNDKLPEAKKKVYFDLNKKLLSRNLLHTMSVFAYDNWSVTNVANTIKENQKNVLKLMKKGYDAYVN
ncbi:hypothetical protein FHR24_001583 [Wenyingzhuangia heitensis]|uniref:GmrSD restriction endonucleases N-terminal domain-containing protein n=1 Tax=Wenyingzhuangia heitensis TaxID=1487859 RepID=A0ABX0U9V5_9FLAO|nr:DUF262 domain-containing protein [Wenyingzhuangia heitensis]NIJ45144.1 hypothetical protein [Wenyingzhuangia heitensis]